MSAEKLAASEVPCFRCGAGRYQDCNSPSMRALVFGVHTERLRLAEWLSGFGDRVIRSIRAEH